MDELKKNKSAQFIAGCGTLALVYFLYTNNFFAFLFNDDPPEGMESVSLATLFLTSLVSAVQLIGILSIGVVTGILKPLAEWSVDAVKSRFPKKVSRTSDDAVDVDKLLSVLNDLDKRLKSLEGGSE
tara:strand:+ start:970 stop:1350 length:381 start_codon:yes stop_codon:yes gene_type:complete